MKKNPPEMLEMKQNTGRDKTKKKTQWNVSAMEQMKMKTDCLSLEAKQKNCSHQTRTRIKIRYQ